MNDRERRLIKTVCAAQFLAQIGAFFWPALLPGLSIQWALSNSEAGWITAIFYAAYVAAVPVLMTLTDRVPASRIYLVGSATTVVGHLTFCLAADSFSLALIGRTLAGIGWAGSYMTGLKLLADKVDAASMARATAAHAVSIGISGAVSFLLADQIAHYAGWRVAFAFAGSSAAIAFMLVALAVPHRAPTLSHARRAALFDFRPVLRNRSAMAYALAYSFHTFEMNALRGWGVALLSFIAMQSAGSGTVLSPAVTLTLLGLIGTAASWFGNEAAIRFGRRRLIAFSMLASVLLAVVLGVVGPHSYLLAAALVLVYGAVIWLDSSSLTAGTTGSADPSQRGATLAVHSMLGYTGGFFGPLAVGFLLDLQGGMSASAWAVAFSFIGALGLASLATFTAMRPKGLAGDRS